MILRALLDYVRNLLSAFVIKTNALHLIRFDMAHKYCLRLHLKLNHCQLLYLCFNSESNTLTFILSHNLNLKKRIPFVFC